MAFIPAPDRRPPRQTDAAPPPPSPACGGAGIGDRRLVADAPASVGPVGASSGQGPDLIEAKAPPPTPSSKEEGASGAPPASAAPASLPANLPALIEALPGDATRPQQTEFTRDRQVQFLLALADSGAVRRAVKAAGVSHQTAYRMRRATPAFRLAWDAALLAARALAEDVLATRALDGVEEKVFYHGEEVATRRRYDSRLLLAHLARLDKLVADKRVTAFAEDFDEALARFERGEEQPEVGMGATTSAQEATTSARVPTTSAHPELVEGCWHDGCTGTLRQAQGERGRGGCAEGDFSSSGQCNNRSMSPADYDADDEVDEYDEMDEHGVPRWARLIDAMDAARPAGAPKPADLCGELWEAEEVEDLQMEAFDAGEDRWWLVVPPQEGEDPDEWHYAEWAGEGEVAGAG